MFSVAPRDRTRKSKLLSFKDAVSRLPKSRKVVPKTKVSKPNSSHHHHVHISHNTSVLVSEENKSSCLRKTHYKTLPDPLPLAVRVRVRVRVPVPVPEAEDREKAIHAAEIKSRFANVIFKAQNHTLFDYSSSVKPNMNNTVNLIKSRREAARNELLKVEQTAAAESDGRDNHQLFKELEDLCGCSLSCDEFNTIPYLQRCFGLKLKNITKAELNVELHHCSRKRIASEEKTAATTTTLYYSSSSRQKPAAKRLKVESKSSKRY